MRLTRFSPNLIRVTGLAVFSLGALLAVASYASAHHRHTYWYHWDNFPSSAISVYSCSPVSATAVQTAIANWNSNGGLGTTLNYAGSSCSSSTGITVRYDSSFCTGCGNLQYTSAVNRPQEVLKDATQQGRLFYQGWSGQMKLTAANANTYSTTDVSVIAHEIGHALGLHEHYVDVTGINSCQNPSVNTVMDCYGADTGPFAHDATDLQTRWQTAPWGTGAIWITGDTGGSTLTLNWADINDNETSYTAYKNGVAAPSDPRDSTSYFFTGLTGGECFQILVSGIWGSNWSSAICRSGVSAPVAPSGVSAYTSPNNYTALLSWTTNSSSYTHEFVTVWQGSTQIAAYYIPNHGTGTFSKYIALGVNDQIPGTYSMEVATCNQTRNPWSGTCVYGGSASVYLSYP